MSQKSTGYWDFFAAEAIRTGSLLYSKLAAGVAGDEALQALAAKAQAGQPHANMLFGAAHFLLLRGARHDLAAYYPTLGGKACTEADDPFPLFVDFARRHGEAMAGLIAGRATNTNEIGRSALLHPGFRAVAEAAKAPLGLIEIGPSAGLNMNWRRYGVRYRSDDAVRVEIAPDAPLVIDCALKGARNPPAGPAPAVAGITGLELNPNDLADADNRDWLRALVWPEHVARLERLEAAIALRLGEPPRMIFGDALEHLVDAVRAVPADAAPCVYHTIAIYQFSGQMKATLEDLLTVAGLRRPVWRLGFEMAADRRYLLTLGRYADGAVDEWLLAEGHPHGNWLEWLA